MIFIKSRKASSTIKNLEAVIQKFEESFAKSFKSCRYVKIHETCEKTPEVEPLFNIFTSVSCFEKSYSF